MNKHLAKDLERYADMLAEGEIVSPDDLNCSAVMRLAAEALAQTEQEPHSWYSKQEDEWMTHKTRKEHERLNSYTHKVGNFDLALYTTPPQRNPLTDEMVLAGARALAKRHADSCGLDFDDVWKYYADEHKDDAKVVIEAAHGIKE